VGLLIRKGGGGILQDLSTRPSLLHSAEHLCDSKKARIPSLPRSVLPKKPRWSFVSTFFLFFVWMTGSVSSKQCPPPAAARYTPCRSTTMHVRWLRT